jgi:hypothetical protein
MLKSLTAVMAAATVAAAVTLLSAPGAQVAAGPMPQAVSAPMRSCTQRAWPYLNCVGTRFGHPKIRLVTTDRLN